MKLTVVILFFIPLLISGQQLTGTWVGSGGGYYLKLVIVQLGDSCFGYTYDEGMGYCRAHFAGKFEPGNQRLKGKGTGFIEKTLLHGLGVYNLNYSKQGETEYLIGTVRAKGAGALVLSLGIPNTVLLTKTGTEVDTTGFMNDQLIAYANRYTLADSLTGVVTIPTVDDVLQQQSRHDPGIAKLPDSVVSSKNERVSKTIQTIITSADSIQIRLYDNGVVDDDTVTVFFDNVVILSRYRITEKAKVLNLPLSRDGRPHVLDLFANNLGSIPPNTALIIVLAGKDRYEVRASYDLSTNASIIIYYKE